MWVNVAVFPEKKLDELWKTVNDSGCSFDEFIYPFLAYPSDGGIMALPEIEPDFFFKQGGGVFVPYLDALQKDLLLRD